MKYNLLKRTFDIIASGTAILLLSPLLLPVIIGLKMTGEGYVFYKQERVGYRNNKFLIWKFATMLKDSANMPGGIMTTKRDPRITPMGGFLRKSKINELPQLFNIFFLDSLELASTYLLCVIMLILLLVINIIRKNLKISKKTYLN